MLIDIRDSYSYQKGHLEGAVSIPSFSLMKNPEQYLDKEKTYTLYCQSGVKSKRVVSFLNALGYHCVNLEGGYSKHLFL